MNDNLIISKKKIKICLIESPPFIFKDPLGNKTGFEYDIIDFFVKENNLDVEYYYIDTANKTKSYNEYIEDLADGKYDILAGNFTQTSERDLLVNFSNPLFLDIVSIFYKSGSNTDFTNYYYKILIVIFQFIGIILILGIFLAFVHYKTSNFKTTFKESLWRVWSALLGEPGLGVNPTKFNDNVGKASTINLGLRALLVLLSALFGIYLGAIITSERVTEVIKTANFSSSKDLLNKKIMVLDGSSDMELLKEYVNSHKVKLISIQKTEKSDYETLTEYYFKNKDTQKIDGLVQSGERFQSSDIDNIFTKGSLMFKKNIGAVAFNKNKKVLLDLFNKTILKLRDNNSIRELCEKYFKDPTNICLQ